MSSLTFSEGSIFAGRYQIIRCIAQGGMGAVYEVIHIETDRRRALKVMLPSFLQSDEMRSRFRQEARVTARIASEYIVDVLDAGMEDATKMPFLVMELLEGEELEQRLKRLGPFAPHDVVTYLHQASLALDKTHRASIVHRDLKPGNLFLTEREDGAPRIKVLDFGIAKLVAEGATGPATQLLGTPLFMAPEQFQVGLRITPAVDIFALGMIVFTLLTGKPYWFDEASLAGSPHAVYVAIMQGPKEPACARAARRGVFLPPAFDAWFAKVTAVDPSARFPAASAAIVALEDVFGVPMAQRAPTLTEVEPTATPAAPMQAPIASAQAPAAPTDLDQATLTPQQLPDRISDAPIAASPALTAAGTLPLPQPDGERAARTSAQSIGAAASSAPTTSANSHAISARPKVRGPAMAAAVALVTTVVVALLAGTVLLMRQSGSGDPASDARATSEGTSAPAESAAAEPSSEPARPPTTAPTEPTPNQTAQATPSAEPSVAPTPLTATAPAIGTNYTTAAPSSKRAKQPPPAATSVFGEKSLFD